LSQLNDAKKIYRKQGDKISEAKMLLQQAIAFDLQNSPTEAIDALIRAEKIFEKGNDKQGLAETWQLLGIFEGRREKQLGLAYLKKSKTLYQEIIKNNKNLYPIIEVIDKHIEELNVD
ncbi:MAG: hypothetical protein OEZ01_18350, partial [Candidatus Heimdallarchaeota archaeon]|nr:hypothetical protein [Candidatus Heimdallarchaeota archaeon]